MNKILEYNVTGQHIELSSAAILVAGTVNEYTARFSFSADWDGYQRVSVFNADGTEREQLLTDNTCTVPWEVLLPGAYLKVGVYGTKAGSRLPTIWTSRRQHIHDGAGPTDEATDPSPVLAEQILQRMGNLDALKTEDKSSLVAAINEVKETGGGGGTSDHSKLKNRDAADQHPMSAITGLQAALDGKQPIGSYVTEELDPTVPGWAKQPQKPAYTAQEVGALPATTPIPSTATDVNAEPAGSVSQHNVSDAAHNDIRLLIQGLTDRLNALADSDDTTLDQLSEVVAYIKSNRDLISAITTSKVNVADIVNNLTTNAANKPLSAAQGVALKALIDELTEAMPEAYTLPIATSSQLGGVKPADKTAEMTQSVGVDEAGALWTAAGGSGSDDLVFSNDLLAEGTIASGLDAWTAIDTGLTLADLREYKSFLFCVSSNTMGLYYGFGAKGGSAKCHINALFEWEDKDKTVLRFAGVGTQYGIIFSNVYNYDTEKYGGNIVPFIRLNLQGVEDTTNISIITQSATTEECTYKVMGWMK